MNVDQGRQERTRRAGGRAAGLLAALLAVLIATGGAWASPTISGCTQCHGSFNGNENYSSLHDGTAWGMNLMDAHVDWVGAEGNDRCLACHRELGPGSVYLATSGLEAYPNGCVGCHGREEDVTGQCTDQPGSALSKQNCGAGAGLRRVHETRVGAGTCSECHTNDPVPAGEDTLPWNYLVTTNAIQDACNADGSEARFGPTGLDNDGDGRRDSEDADCSFPINPGLNDAWYNPATNGQGLLITVFENSVFVAWFTFDVEQPPADASAVLGHPGHRWLTAQGPFEGDTAALTLLQTSGGLFDSADPPVDGPVAVGELTIRFLDCQTAELTYDIDGVGAGMMTIYRIAQDNVPLCEMLVESVAAQWRARRR
jgi:hypothetical protein